MSSPIRSVSCVWSATPPTRFASNPIRNSCSRAIGQPPSTVSRGQPQSFRNWRNWRKMGRKPGFIAISRHNILARDIGHVIARIAPLKGRQDFCGGGRHPDRQGRQGLSMEFRKPLMAGLTAVALMMSPMSTFAQDATPPAEAPAAEAPAAEAPATTAETPGSASQNWLKVCDPLPDGQKACIMRQVVLANGQFLGSFLLRDDPGQESRLLA